MAESAFFHATVNERSNFSCSDVNCKSCKCGDDQYNFIEFLNQLSSEAACSFLVLQLKTARIQETATEPHEEANDGQHTFYTSKRNW